MVDVGAALVADGEPAEAMPPGDGSLHHPAVSAEALGAVDAASGDPGQDVAPPAGVAAAAVIIGLVGVELAWPAARASALAAEGRHRIEGGLEHQAVVAVGRADEPGERLAAAVGDDVVLRARLAAVGRVRPGLGAPLFAGTDALSRQARLQSMRSASASFCNSSRCRAAQTPAACQSRRRRQQLMPQPQPISWGNISQGMPERSTKRMPVSAARLGTAGRPPLGRGRGCGRSGAASAHSASGTRGLAMRHQRTRPSFVRCSKPVAAVE